MKNGFLACLRLRVCSNFFEFRKIITHELAIFRGIRKIATAQALFGRSIKVSINVRGSHSWGIKGCEISQSTPLGAVSSWVQCAVHCPVLGADTTHPSEIKGCEISPTTSLESEHPRWHTAQCLALLPHTLKKSRDVRSHNSPPLGASVLAGTPPGAWLWYHTPLRNQGMWDLTIHLSGEPASWLAHCPVLGFGTTCNSSSPPPLAEILSSVGVYLSSPESFKTGVLARGFHMS